MSYVAVRTIPAGSCTGRGCPAVDTEIVLVYSEARFHHDPDAANVSAWLCPACLAKLGDRVRPIDIPDRLPERGPYLYRGKPVESF